MDVTQIAAAYLAEHGYDGLCVVEDGKIECGCGLGQADFAPCGGVQAACLAARGNWSDGFVPRLPP
jgi:hypothetical protein